MCVRPTLALLIPAFNAAPFLPRLLKSAQEQTHPFDEIWVYDDCSTDDTAAVASAYGANVIRGDVNVGCSAGRNALAQRVTVDWLHFHDADDLLLPNFVSLARRWIDKDSHDVVLFDYEWREEGSNQLLSLRRFDATALDKDARAFAILEQINPFCGLYRREAFVRTGGYDTDPLILYNEDVAFHIAQAFAGLRFGVESEVSIVNYRRQGSMSVANAAECAIAHYHVLRRTLELDRDLKYRKEIGAKLWNVAGVLGGFSKWSEAYAAAELARSLAFPSHAAGSIWFRSVAAISPKIALRAREYSVRALKPGLRTAS